MKLVYISPAFIVLSILWMLYMYFIWDWNDIQIRTAYLPQMAFEVFSFLLTTVLVGGAALLYNFYKEREAESAENIARDTEKRNIQRHRLEEFFHQFTETYNEIKFYRREARHHLLMEGEERATIDSDEYAKLMRALNARQLRLEHFRRIFESKPDFLKALKIDGFQILRQSEKYLRDITAEYECRSLRQRDEKLLEISSRDRLFQFVVSRSNKSCDRSSKDRFFDPLDDLFVSLSRQLEESD